MGISRPYDPFPTRTMDVGEYVKPVHNIVSLLREKVFGVQDGKIDMNILADAGSFLKELFSISWAKINF
jgi:hypothetical protein